MIAQHFEATIKDHPKMKLREFQRRCASKMHVNVTINCCYRAKKIVKEKIAGNHKEEFGLLDYAHELRSKMLGSTIKMIVNCTTEKELEDLCSALEKKDKDSYYNLMKKSPKIWTREFWGTTCKSDIVDNNLCEAFIQALLKLGSKAFIRMLEDIRTKMMTKIVQKRKLYNGWKQDYCPLVKVNFDANKKDYVK
ncbi:hypothetical protein PVK06_012348 [Gossypium arboreum]|uniref:Uncharacterized protein n=1 Tax=Gossypium arboreum TaxID=29729 RepID=A0ABR0QBW7_GOSAR|nr:hypothetical protein PVK06_012348 [Gossypium arboreum]